MKAQNETSFPKQNPEAMSVIWSDPSRIYITGSAPSKQFQGKVV